MIRREGGDDAARNGSREVGSVRHCGAGEHLRRAQDVTKDGVKGFVVRSKERGARNAGELSQAQL